MGVEKDTYGKFVPEFMQDNNFMFNPQDMFMTRMETPLISALEVLEKVGYLSAIGDVNPFIPWDYKEISIGDRLMERLVTYHDLKSDLDKLISQIEKEIVKLDKDNAEKGGHNVSKGTKA